MILHTPLEYAKAEGELRAYLENHLGRTDAERLALFTWENSATPAAYMDGLAYLSRGVSTNGTKFVEKLLVLAHKPKEVREAELELTVFGARLVNELVNRILGAVEADRPKLAEECAAEMNHRMREKLNAMWPGTPDYMVNGALLAGCHWHRESGSFEIDQVKLVGCMRQADPMKV